MHECLHRCSHFLAEILWHLQQLDKNHVLLDMPIDRNLVWQSTTPCAFLAAVYCRFARCNKE